MPLLLDTHVLLWWLLNDRRLGAQSRAAIASGANSIQVSAATIWEGSIKAGLGRLDLKGLDLVTEVATEGFLMMPITADHAWRAGSLPQHHHDPFDRLLVAQTELEQMTLVTANVVLAAYGVPILKA